MTIAQNSLGLAVALLANRKAFLLEQMEKDDAVIAGLDAERYTHFADRLRAHAELRDIEAALEKLSV